MDLEYGPEYDDFRSEVTNFIKENEDVKLSGPMRDESRVNWQQKLIDNGYFARSVPKEYGGYGGDMDIIKLRIIAEEFAKSPIPKAMGGQGIQMLVPTLLSLGTEEQKQQYIRPTLRGEMIWCQGYSEPNSGSDLASLQTKGELDGDEWVINGRKWFASNATHEKCELIVVVGVTDSDAPKSKRQSLFLVPRHAEGISIMRNLPVFDHLSPTNRHPEFEMKNVRIPAENLLGELGAGFAIGQARLGPARLHHCMRTIGECEVLISLMVKRSQERTTFGKRIDEYSSTQEAISMSRIELDQARLLVQRAAHQLDTIGNKAARKQISMIKVAVARIYQSIADRAVQLYGAKGVTNDTPAARAFGKARAFRIYDGPDEVHLQTIARIEAGEQDLTLMDYYLG